MFSYDCLVGADRVVVVVHRIGDVVLSDGPPTCTLCSTPGLSQTAERARLEPSRPSPLRWGPGGARLPCNGTNGSRRASWNVCRVPEREADALLSRVATNTFCTWFLDDDRSEDKSESWKTDVTLLRTHSRVSDAARTSRSLQQARHGTLSEGHRAGLRSLSCHAQSWTHATCGWRSSCAPRRTSSTRRVGSACASTCCSCRGRLLTRSAASAL